MGGAAHGEAAQWQDASVVDVAAVVCHHHRHLVLQRAEQTAESIVRMYYVRMVLLNLLLERTKVAQVSFCTVALNSKQLHVTARLAQGLGLLHDKRCHPLVISTNNNQNPHQYF